MSNVSIPVISDTKDVSVYTKLPLISVGTEKPQRRGSVGSLDSGMSISFQSTSASTGSRSDTKIRLIQHTTPSGQVIVQQAPPPPGHAAPTQPPTLTHQQRRERKMSRSDDTVANGTGPYGRSTEV